MDPTNRTAYTFQWNGNVQHTLRRQLPLRGGLHRQPELQRAQALQHQPGAARHDADRDARAVPGVPVGDSVLVRCRLGAVQRPVVPPRQALLGRHVLPRQLPAVEEHRQRLGRDRSERHRVCLEPRRRRGLLRATTSGTARRSASVTSCRSGRASGGSRAAARPRTCFGGWQVQGIVRLAQRVPVLGDVDQRLPVRLVHPAARQRRQRPATSESSTTRTPTRWFDPNGVRRAGATARRARRGATPCAARGRSR